MTPNSATVHRRTVATLAAAQAVGAVGITIGVAASSLLAAEISGSERQAGLTQTAQVLGAAVVSVLLATVMGKRGRRPGLVLGYGLGALGGLVIVMAGILESMGALLLGAGLLGATTSASMASRFAAADLATDENRGRSLSIVVWATTLGAVAGPNLTGLADEISNRLGIGTLTGPFVIGSVAIVLAALIVAMFLRPDPLVVSRATAGGGPAASSRPGGSWLEALRVIAARRPLAAAVGGLSAAHAVMVAVMVMTPLHMDHGGATLSVIGMVISVHVLGMYAFAPLVGLAADRWGRRRVLAVGGVVLLGALVLSGGAPEGSSPQIFGGLFLLGLGWSLATISASALVADEAPLAVRTDVQGVADTTMGLVAAAGGAAAGLVVAEWGFPMLNLFAAALALGVLVAAWRAGPTSDDVLTDDSQSGNPARSLAE
jgi:MFS family permease